MNKHKELMIKKKLKKTWYGKIIYFVWYEDSLLSWIANIVIAFLFIKFIFYPLIGLMFGTQIPVVAVLSCSMQHGFTDCGTAAPEALCGVSGSGLVNYDEYWKYCGDFYENINISKEDFSNFPMYSGFNKGDIIFLKGFKASELETGEIIVFNSLDRAYPIIHRVISNEMTESHRVIQTKGDHNVDQISDSGLDEKNVMESQILGKAFFRIPYLGYVKIWFTQLVSLFM